MNQKILLNTFLTISIIIIISTNILLNDEPEIFSKGHEIGNILSNLSLAYFSSYIFYIIVVVYKEKKDRKNIYSVIYKTAKELVYQGNSVITIITKLNHFEKENLLKTISKEEFINLCEQTNSQDTPPSIKIHGQLNYPIFEKTHGSSMYDYSITNCKNEIEKVFLFMPFLDSELIKIMNEILESNHFKRFSSFNSFINQAEDLYDFHLLMRKLDNYIDKNYKKYILNSTI